MSVIVSVPISGIKYSYLSVKSCEEEYVTLFKRQAPHVKWQVACDVIIIHIYSRFHLDVLNQVHLMLNKPPIIDMTTE